MIMQGWKRKPTSVLELHVCLLSASFVSAVFIASWQFLISSRLFTTTIQVVLFFIHLMRTWLFLCHGLTLALWGAKNVTNFRQCWGNLTLTDHRLKSTRICPKYVVVGQKREWSGFSVPFHKIERHNTGIHLHSGILILMLDSCNFFLYCSAGECRSIVPVSFCQF